MKIYKYLHSCILIEDDDRRLLIDPGELSFIEKKIKPEDIGAVNAILLTHKHSDHYFPEALKIISKSGETKIIGNREIAEQAILDGLAVHVADGGETFEAGGFSVKTISARHGDIPAAVPENTAYFINQKILHPGDSLAVSAEEARGCEVLLLPVTAPWLRLVDSLGFALKINSTIAIPIHDVITKDFMLTRIYNMCAKKLAESNIEFKPLKVGEFIEV